MNVTVAICTWNRAPLLDQTLTHMRHLSIPPGVEWQLFIVNNNCTDDTDAVIDRHGAYLPIRRLFEPRQGQSNARNCAVGAASGELLVWTDDDVLVRSDWLEHYVRAAEQWPDMSFFGGSIIPWFEAQPPEWIKKNLDRLKGAFALVDDDGQVQPMEPGELPFGANMAFRMECAKAYKYDARLGLKGDNQIRGDETELFDRMIRDGHKGLWVKTANVSHYLPAKRLTMEYVSEWSRGRGRAVVLAEGCKDDKLVWGMPRWAARQYLVTKMMSIMLYPRKNSRWLESVMRSSFMKGMCEESRRACAAGSKV